MINKNNECGDYIVLATSNKEAMVVNPGNSGFLVGYKFELMPTHWEDYDGTVTLSNE